MKALIIASALITFKANAVITKSCPEKLQLTYSIDQLYNNHPNDNWNEQGIEATIEELESTETISMETQLISTASSTCSYRGETLTGEYAYITLSGSTRSNAKNKAKLTVYAKNTVVYIPVSRVSPSGLAVKSDSLNIYYRGEYCSWGDCAPKYFRIGSITLLELK